MTVAPFSCRLNDVDSEWRKWAASRSRRRLFDSISPKFKLPRFRMGVYVWIVLWWSNGHNERCVGNDVLSLFSFCLMAMFRNCTSMSASSSIDSGDSTLVAVAIFEISVDAVAVGVSAVTSLASTVFSNAFDSSESMLSMSTISSSFVGSILIGNSAVTGELISTVTCVTSASAVARGAAPLSWSEVSSISPFCDVLALGELGFSSIDGCGISHQN